MHRSIFVHVRAALAAALLPSLPLTLSACQHDAKAVPNNESSQPRARRNVNVTTAARTQPANTDPCSWVTAEEVAKLLGPLAAAPWRADHADSPDSASNGHACVYPLEAHDQRPPDAPMYSVALELETDAVTATDASAGSVKMMQEQLARTVGQTTAAEVTDAVTDGGRVPQEWDNARWLPASFVGRVGGIAIDIESNNGMFAPNVAVDSIERLAALVRDRVPDIPIASPHASRFGGDNPDACQLLTRAEAEAVLGRLTTPPYRSEEAGLADPSGDGCSYFLGRHRVFSIQPVWSSGKMTFRMVGKLGQIVSTAGIGEKGADTLEGSWDEASSGVGGVLYFLTGDRMLEVYYGAASVDAPTALRLASIAVKRLADAECRDCD